MPWEITLAAITLAGLFGLVIYSTNQEEPSPSGTESDTAVSATTARRLAA